MQYPSPEKRLLKCKCDICQKDNYTCTTTGGCLTILRREDGIVKRARSCTFNSPGHHFICRPAEDEQHKDVKHHCCYYNMCNVDANVTLPTTKPISVDSKGEYQKVISSYM